MSDITIPAEGVAPSEQDELKLKDELDDIKLNYAPKYESLLIKESKGIELTAEEINLITNVYVPKMRRGVTITRILRRTNTGPAKVKAAKAPTKKALREAEIAKAMSDII